MTEEITTLIPILSGTGALGGVILAAIKGYAMVERMREEAAARLDRLQRESERRERRCEARLNLHRRRDAILRQLIAAAGVGIGEPFAASLVAIDDAENRLLSRADEEDEGQG